MRTKRKPPDPLGVLFGAYRRRLLALLLLRPEQRFYVREIERLTGIPAGSLHRELGLLTRAGLVERMEEGRQVLYRANRHCPVFEGLVNMLAQGPESGPSAKPTAPLSLPPASTRAVGARRDLSVSQVLRRLSASRRALAVLCGKYGIVRLSFFGSVTRDDFRPDSDVDVRLDFAPDRTPGMYEIVALKDELSQLFGGRSVDMLTNPVIRNPFRRRSIERDMLVAYAA